ncbi:RNA-binding S4 domain-containing protein [Altericroceibacterium xinjiangense]|uniref:RNA-binding S4 domain-containing protein n=1 Tax=Altericroceibacterium xinjiangense TaxID=762261 RepID=UPI000F7EE223|nr:S4 domain-containing protein [Altericroceibacterium xinjiangense]
MRIDRLLCFLRFAKTRSLAQRWIGEGHIRRNGQRVVRCDQAIAPGDVLTLPLARSVLAIRILALPHRRGPADEARACYRALDAGGAIAIAGGERPPEEGTKQP